MQHIKRGVQPCVDLQIYLPPDTYLGKTKFSKYYETYDGTDRQIQKANDIDNDNLIDSNNYLPLIDAPQLVSPVELFKLSTHPSVHHRTHPVQ